MISRNSVVQLVLHLRGAKCFTRDLLKLVQLHRSLAIQLDEAPPILLKERAAYIRNLLRLQGEKITICLVELSAV